jgi:hypothetical protein
MRLKLLLPTVEPERWTEPSVCPRAGCGGRHFQLRQTLPKPLRDTQLTAVTARRYGCLRCGHTFRVYPAGASAALTSSRLRGVGVLLYLLGLSYGAVSLALQALGHPLSKTAVYYAVQAAGERVPGLRRDAVQLPRGQALLAALGADLTSVKCKGHWVEVGVSVDAVGGAVVSVDLLPGSDTATLSGWVQELAQAVGATVLVSDDADAFKTAGRQAGLSHQVCKAHVVRNTDAWIDQNAPSVASDADGSLAEIAVSPTQALADLERLKALAHERPPGGAAYVELRALHERYQAAPTPVQRGEAHPTLAYRLRMFTLDRWNLWHRLTHYRHWRGPAGETLDGTNNGCERAIGWWVKERYRSMRGYKRRRSILNVSRLLAWAGNQLHGPGADLGLLVA